MSKCQHKGCNVTIAAPWSSGEFCHRHEPVRCPLCNRVLGDIMNKNQEHGPNRCVISIEAYKALETKIKRTINILDTAIGDTDPEVIDYSEHPMIHAMHILLGMEE